MSLLQSPFTRHVRDERIADRSQVKSKWEWCNLVPPEQLTARRQILLERVAGGKVAVQSENWKVVALLKPGQKRSEIDEKTRVI